MFGYSENSGRVPHVQVVGSREDGQKPALEEESVAILGHVFGQLMTTDNQIDLEAFAETFNDITAEAKGDASRTHRPSLQFLVWIRPNKITHEAIRRNNGWSLNLKNIYLNLQLLQTLFLP